MRGGLLLLLLLPCVGCVSTAGPWPTVANTTIASDCALTVVMLEGDPQVIEVNPLLGQHPTPGEIALWCGVGMVATQGVADLMPSRWRVPWLLGVSLIEIGFVINNVLVILN